MNFVESLNMFGVEAKEIPCIKGSGAPTASTAGAVGSFYMNTENGDVYKCTAEVNGGRTWEAFETAVVIPTKVSEFENDAGYLTEHQDISGKLDASKLPEAINTALAQAKASGEFDGADGKDGKDGYTPQKNVDYFDGEDGKDGTDGKAGQDGVSPVVSVSDITGGHRITITDKNGTKTVDVMDGADGEDGKNGNGIKSAVLNADYTLTLTFDDGTKYTTPSIRGATGATGSAGKDGSAGAAGKDGTSVTVTKVAESSADGGSNVVTFSDGKTVTIKNGSKGSTGAAGGKGADGVGISSIKQTATSTEDGGNNVFTVTLTNGTSATFTVKNGSKGSKGATGSAGTNGEDGKTPVRGTDYWTDSDIAEIKSYVDDAILGGAW